MIYLGIEHISFDICFYLFSRQTKGMNFPIWSRGCWAVMKMTIIPIPLPWSLYAFPLMYLSHSRIRARQIWIDKPDLYSIFRPFPPTVRKPPLVMVIPLSPQGHLVLLHLQTTMGILPLSLMRPVNRRAKPVSGIMPALLKKCALTHLTLSHCLCSVPETSVTLRKPVINIHG